MLNLVTNDMPSAGDIKTKGCTAFPDIIATELEASLPPKLLNKVAWPFLSLGRQCRQGLAM